MNRKHHERGTALLFALVVIVILSAGTSVLWSQLHQNLAQHRAAWHQEQAFQLAEAGLADAISALRAGDHTIPYNKTITLDVGQCAIGVVAGNAPQQFIATVTSTLGEGRERFDTVTLEANLTLAPDGRVTAYTWRRLRKGARS